MLYDGPHLSTNTAYVPANEREALEDGALSLDTFCSQLEDGYRSPDRVADAAYALTACMTGDRLAASDPQAHRDRTVLGLRNAAKKLEDQEFRTFLNGYMDKLGVTDRKAFLNSYRFGGILEQAAGDERSGVSYTAAAQLCAAAAENDELRDELYACRIATDTEKNVRYKTILGRGLAQADALYGTTDKDLPDNEARPYLELVEELADFNPQHLGEYKQTVDTLFGEGYGSRNVFRIDNRIAVATEVASVVRDLAAEMDEAERAATETALLLAVDHLFIDLAEKDPVKAYVMRRELFG